MEWDTPLQLSFFFLRLFKEILGSQQNLENTEMSHVPTALYGQNLPPLSSSPTRMVTYTDTS